MFWKVFENGEWEHATLQFEAITWEWRMGVCAQMQFFRMENGTWEKQTLDCKKNALWEWRMTSANKSALLRMENGNGGTYAPGNPRWAHQRSWCLL